MKLTLTTICILILSFCAFGQKMTATTEDGKKVVLNPDKTWEYVEKENSAQDDSETDKPREIKIVSLGILNGRAEKLVVPAYPDEAKSSKASGTVNVEITIDTDGKVLSAAAVSGDSRLRKAAEEAALRSKFKPTILSGKPVKAKGILIYNFVAQ